MKSRTSVKEQKLRSQIVERFSDTGFLRNAIANATRDAVIAHKHAGNPIAIWRDGKVVIVPPEEIDALLAKAK